MNSPDTTPQLQAIEASIEKLIAKPITPGDGTSVILASQMMQKDNLRNDLMQQVKLNQDQMIKDQMEQARLRSEIAYKTQLQQSQARQEQTQRDQQSQAKLRAEQIQRYEQQQTKLKQDQMQREQLEQSKRRQEQMQRDQVQQARLRQEQIQREQQMQARLKQEQVQREKARQEQMQKDRAQQEKLKHEQAQKELLLAARLKEERERVNQLKQPKNELPQSDKKSGKVVPKTPEQLAKDEEARAFSSRTEMSLTSIAFCSPLMLFGMGAAMSIFDNFSGKDKNSALLEARKKSTQQQELSEYARVQADKKFKEMVERGNLTNLSNVPDASATKFGQKVERTEKTEKPKVNRFVAAETPVVVRKNDSLEVKKLWKERQRLLEHLERVRGQGGLALVSKLVSQLETLDRSLKRLGCDPQA